MSNELGTGSGGQGNAGPARLFYVAGVVVAIILGLFGFGAFDKEGGVSDAPVKDAAPVEQTAEAAVEEQPAVEQDTADVSAKEETSAPDETATTEARDGVAASTSELEAAPVDLPEPPRFDVVRIEADGTTVIAGSAAPEGDVDILLDEAAIHTLQPDADGKFSAFLSIAPAQQPRLMALLWRRGEVTLRSTDQVVIAPAPVVVAEAPLEVSEEGAPEGVQEQAGPTDLGGAPEQAAATDVVETQTEASQDTAASDRVEVAQENAPEAVAPAPVAAPEAATEDAAAPVVIIAGNDGVRVVQPAAEAAPEELVLDAISYAATGAVELTGRGMPGAALRAYLNNQPVADSEVAQTGRWLMALNDIAPGLYQLRIDQLDATGKVTARVETPFQRETEEVVASANAVQNAAEAPAATEKSAQTSAVSEGDVEVAAAEEGQPSTQASVGDLTTATEAEAVESDSAAATDTQPQAAATAPSVRVVTVQPGNTLWAIARDSYGDGVLYVRVFEANKTLIRDPDLIYPGQIFTVPE